MSEILDGLFDGSVPSAPTFLQLELSGRETGSAAADLLRFLDRASHDGIRGVRLVEELGAGPIDLEPLLRGLRERRLVLSSLVTNGLALTEGAVEELTRSRCEEVVVRVLTPDGADYSRLTGGTVADLDRVQDRVRQLAAGFEGGRSPRLVTRFIFDRANFRRLTRMMWTGWELGSHLVELESYQPDTAGGRLAASPLAEPEGAVLHSLLQVITADVRYDGIRLRLPYPSWRVMQRSWEKRAGARTTDAAEPPRVAVRPQQALGALAWSAVTIDTEGAVRPLVDLFPSRLPPLARLRDFDLRSAWHGEHFGVFRREMRELFLTGGRVFCRPGRFRFLGEPWMRQALAGEDLRALARGSTFASNLRIALGAFELGARPWPWPASGLGRSCEIFAFRAYHWLRGRAGFARAEANAAPPEAGGARRPVQLHIGSGGQRLEGWVNLDLRPLRGVDVVADVTVGLPFRRATAVYAEHFLEHIEAGEALTFLDQLHAILEDDGWLRLSTPNLDWVWSTQYGEAGEGRERRNLAFAANRSFYGWGHRFLWNRELLELALEACGFEAQRWCRPGESELPVFLGMEQHERSADTDELPHVLIVEARKGTPDPESRRRLEKRLGSRLPSPRFTGGGL